MSKIDRLFNGGGIGRRRSNGDGSRVTSAPTAPGPRAPGPQAPGPQAPGPRASGERTAQTRQYSGIITIRRVNQSAAPAPAPVPSNVTVVDRDIGRGIHINRQKDPSICPQCRTRGMVTRIRTTAPQWRCGRCGHEF